MEDRKKLIDALQVIVNECDKHECCDNSCPFYDGQVRCTIKRDHPCNWKLSDPEESFWRAIL